MKLFPKLFSVVTPITKGKSLTQYVDFFSGDLPVLAPSTAKFLKNDKNVHSKCSSGHVQCSYDNPAENLTHQKVFGKSSTKSFKMFRWTCTMQVSEKLPKFFR